MRFWSVTQGQIHVNDTAIKDINTKDLRQMQGYVTQDTVLFHDSILNNIRIAKLNASIDEVEAACKRLISMILLCRCQKIMLHRLQNLENRYRRRTSAYCFGKSFLT